MTGKRYTEEFKVQPVRQVTEGKPKVAKMAARLGITKKRCQRQSVGDDGNCPLHLSSHRSSQLF